MYRSMVNGQCSMDEAVLLCFSFYMLCLIETDDVAAGFYLEAGLQGKSCGHSSKDAVDNMEKGFSLFFFKYL